MKNILVTGGAGYIGSHTCVELLSSGYNVVVIDNLCNSKEISLKRVQEITNKSLKFIKADLLDKQAITNVFEQNDIDAVIHFAGLKAVGESTEKPLAYYNNNVGSTINLCEVMMEYNVKNIVFSSSATVYGDPDELPIKESAPTKPTNPYGRTKLMIEELLRDIHTSDPDWNISILRYFNPVGAHESGKIGEDPNGIPNNLMPYLSQVAAGNMEKLLVFGDDYPTKDGTGVRDYIHVVDLASGHSKALQKLTDAPGLMIHNLGTGKGYSVLEVISAFENAAGKIVPYEITERRPGDIATNYADCHLSNTKLNWQAKKDILEMSEDTWRWALMNPKGYL